MIAGNVPNGESEIKIRELTRFRYPAKGFNTDTFRNSQRRYRFT